ncbi:hypothetical protein ASG12_14110 [Williamsia sp. Leaf354]|uniref:hypothetical protein n=1 Tax=Williamsia sp. Leaf354 TaxID=1736349 RepID=UPI0006FC2D74|nr:hypothetical protein [Williamsia sp. Leaf354]KQR98093.1 hypothetical protein ASG12_14110 [Williamsia sp. Leaf354]
MIETWRLWTGEDGDSHTERGVIDLHPERLTSSTASATSVHFAETAPGADLGWHPAPRRQLVITLSGVLHFRTRDDEGFTLRPGVVLLAEDTTGTGHVWHLDPDTAWRRAYVVLADDTDVGFRADN